MRAGGLCAISVILVAVLLISGFGRSETWSLHHYVGIEAYYTRATFSVWKPKEWNNGTDTLWQKSFDASPTSIVLGLLGTIANCHGWFQEHVLLDIVFLLSLVVSGHMSRLIRIIEDESMSLDRKWEEYDKMRKLSDKINTTFQYFLPLSHINNLFLLSYFLLGGFQKIRTVYIILIGAKVAKMLLTYCITASTARKVT